MGKKNGALLSICSNSLLILMKVIVGLTIGSVSIISEAIHSSIDLLASLIAFFSIREAAKDPDTEHPFGHQKFESVSGFVEALLILLAGVLIIVEAAKKITAQNVITDVNAGIIVMFIGSLVNLFISRMLLIITRKQNSIALEADAMHLLTDVFTSAGVMAGLILIKITGFSILDVISAFIVALLIIRTSIKLIKESMVDLVDTKLKDDDIENIENIISSFKEIKLYHKMRTRKAGNDIEVDVHIIMDKNMNLEDTHTLCDKLENEIQSEYPKAYVVLHPEPYETDKHPRDTGVVNH